MKNILYLLFNEKPMIVAPETTIKETVEFLLQREIEESDKLLLSDIAEAEKRLHLQLPPSLKELYLYCVNNQILMNSHNQFMIPEKLELVNNYLVFIEENQGVCWWGVKTDENDPIVYMQTEENGEWYSEDVTISQFIILSLYFQCAMSGYENCGMVHLPENKLFTLLEKEWKQVVNHNGLVIYAKASCLIWYFTDNDGDVTGDGIYFSSLTSESYDEHFEKYDLDEI